MIVWTGLCGGCGSVDLRAPRPERLCRRTYSQWSPHPTTSPNMFAAWRVSTETFHVDRKKTKKKREKIPDMLIPTGAEKQAKQTIEIQKHFLIFFKIIIINKIYYFWVNDDSIPF